MEMMEDENWRKRLNEHWLPVAGFARQIQTNLAVQVAGARCVQVAVPSASSIAYIDS
jgi:hypothetical protein